MKQSTAAKSRLGSPDLNCATEHFLPGKDASLEASIARMQQTLSRLGFRLEERAWQNPMEAVWSVHLVDQDCPLLHTNGKGSSQLAARASALGEFFERLTSHHFWSQSWLGSHYAAQAFVHASEERWFPPGKNGRWPKALLTPELQAFYNPERYIDAEMLVDFNTGNVERGICALPFTRLSDGQPVWFPVSLLNNLYVSNGLAAGNTPEEAQAQALAEIVERHVKFRVLRESLCLPEVPAEVIARYPAIAAGLATLRAAGYGLLVQDASLGGRFPVICITLMNPKDQGCYASFGAHPRQGIALERALTELLQGRALDALDGFPPPSFDREEVSSPANIETHFIDSSGVIGWDFLGDTPDFPFCDWNFSQTTVEDRDWLVDCLHREGFEIYLSEPTPLDMYTCRIVVPGCSEIYPIDDLEYDNVSIGNTFREAILCLTELDVDDCAALLDTLNDADIADERLVAVLIGLAPDPGSRWEELRVGELKTLLALSIGDEAAIDEGCDWIRHFGEMAPERQRVYRCIETLRQFGDNVPRPVKELYGSEVFQQAQALLSGKNRFFGIPSPGLELVGCQSHQALLAAYGKVYRVFRNETTQENITHGHYFH